MQSTVNSSSTSNTDIFPQVTYINFVFFTIELLCTFTSIFNMSRLLYFSKFKKSSLKVNEISNTMKLYLAVNVICSITTLPYLLYKVIWWRPPNFHENQPLYSFVIFHFISGIFYALHFSVSSILVFILCLDRCLVIKMSNIWEEKKRKIFLKLGIFIVIIVYFGCGFSYFFELPLDYDILKYCETQTCMQHRLKNFPILCVKTCFGICNIICCIIFLKLLARVGGDTAKKLITGYSLSVFTGELSYLTLSLEIAICGLFYWKKFKTNPGTQITLLTSQKNLNNTPKQPWTVNIG
uniref:G_PROTEIN_RECEP_F1_2 domain-containing protein n=1 Tax=Meloidogyne hapla TaxID=6305 RepID=A0A1I8B2D8_MELHA